MLTALLGARSHQWLVDCLRRVICPVARGAGQLHAAGKGFRPEAEQVSSVPAHTPAFVVLCTKKYYCHAHLPPPNQRGFISEEATAPIGTHKPLPAVALHLPSLARCSVMEKLLERYFAAMREVKALQQTEEANTTDTETAESQSGFSAKRPRPLRWGDEPAQHQPAGHRRTARTTARLVCSPPDRGSWFDYALADTSGFFDDAAHGGCQLCAHGELMDRVRYAYRKATAG